MAKREDVDSDLIEMGTILKDALGAQILGLQETQNVGYYLNNGIQSDD